jgi:DNA-binding LacI/PurR family transcriptional regulator
MKKDVTIEDVADDAGVSKSTVSAVINDRDVVKNSTRQQVLDSIQRLDYRPRGSAQRLSGSSIEKTIGFVIKESGNPYYSEVLDGIQEVARSKNYLTYTCSSEGKLEVEQQIVRQFSDKDLKGLIITPILNDNTDLSHVFDLDRGNVPYVLLEDIRGVQAHLVDIDNVKASSEAVRHLIELGHERIAHFAGPSYSEHTQERLQGVERAFSRSTLAFHDNAIVETGDSFEEGYEKSIEFFTDGPGDVTAVTCYNDLVALGVMKGLNELGIGVPDDVSVVGFDDLQILDYLPVSLTTVRVPKREMGRRAAKLLLKQISADVAPPQRIALNAELVVRSSTAPIGEVVT